MIFKHLEGSSTHAKILFVDFSSAFNTILPHILVDKLISNFKLDHGLVGWILDFLTNRTQQVRVNGVLSNKMTSSTGSPQGCVLSPLLYILYTNDCRSQHENRHIIKFADDSIILSLLHGSETDHGPVLDDFIAWCDSSHLHLNVTKTKDMVIDFRRNPLPALTTTIKGQAVEVVESYKYLGSWIDNKLNFNRNTEHICKKSQQRLFCLRKLAKFNVDKTMMTLFYKAYIESVLSFSICCWFNNLSVKARNSLTKIVKVSGKIIGAQQSSLTDLHRKATLRKAESILSVSAHPLHSEFQLLPSGSRFRFPSVKTNRFRFSFVPSAISLLNSNPN